MAVKFNGGNGAHICDRCRKIICSGTPRQREYFYFKGVTPVDHWIAPMSVNNIGRENLLAYSAEYCTSCAVTIQITDNITLINAKEFFKL